MQILPLQCKLQPAARLQSQAFDAAVDVLGLSAGELAWMFGYPGGQSFAWSALRNRGIIRVALAASSCAPKTDDPRFTVELDDGTVQCCSDQPAELKVLEQHDSPSDRLARSLNLALSQQWARAGIMLVHAAGVAISGTGVLILGSKASGKSTLTAAVLAAEGQAVSDDWMLLGLGRDGQPRMERMRGFLMLRHSWASETLLAQPANLQFYTQADRPKYVLAIPEDTGRFPTTHRVDLAVKLLRPRPRPKESRSRSAPPHSLMAALMSAGMPLLFGRGFSAERENLNNLAAQLLNQLETTELICGTDLPAHPDLVKRILVTQAVRVCNPVDASQ